MDIQKALDDDKMMINKITVLQRENKDLIESPQLIKNKNIGFITIYKR